MTDKLPAGTATPVETQQCKWCVAEGQPEWSKYANVWIHRRDTLDKACLNPPPPPDWAAIREKVDQQARESFQKDVSKIGKVATPVETASPDECQRCHQTMLTRDGEEATEICDHCAHDKVSELESQLTQVRSQLDKTELDMVYWLRRGRAAEEKGEKLELALTQVREEHRIARNEVL